MIKQHLNTEVAYCVKQDKVFLDLRQSDVTHPNTFETISNLTSLHPGKTIVLQSGSKEPLARGDEDPVARAEGYNSLYSALFKLHMSPSCSLVRGLAIGVDAGLALLTTYKGFLLSAVRFHSEQSGFVHRLRGILHLESPAKQSDRPLLSTNRTNNHC